MSGRAVVGLGAILMASVLVPSRAEATKGFPHPEVKFKFTSNKNRFLRELVMNSNPYKEVLRGDGISYSVGSSLHNPHYKVVVGKKRLTPYQNITEQHTFDVNGYPEYKGSSRADQIGPLELFQSFHLNDADDWYIDQLAVKQKGRVMPQVYDTVKGRIPELKLNTEEAKLAEKMLHGLRYNFGWGAIFDGPLSVDSAATTDKMFHAVAPLVMDEIGASRHTNHP